MPRICENLLPTKCCTQVAHDDHFRLLHARLLLAYQLREDGTVGPRKVLHDFKKDRGIDGMCIDVKGNIYATAGQGKTGGVYVFTAAGKQIGFIPTPETPTNCVVGDHDRKTLYVTAGRSLYRVKLNAEGFAVYWPKSE